MDSPEGLRPTAFKNPSACAEIHRRASGGVLRLLDCFVLLAAVAFRFRSIGDNRSTIMEVEGLPPGTCHLPLATMQ